jgi:hypothetical protein
MSGTSTSVEPALPRATGPLSRTVLGLLAGEPPMEWPEIDVAVRDSNSYGLDLQLALCVCYELHYRGFAGVKPEWEWDPRLVGLRAALEDTFLATVRRDAGEIGSGETAARRWMHCRSSRSTAKARRITYATAAAGSRCEYFVHRSLYHLKRA